MEKWNDRLVYALKVRKKTQADLVKVTGAKAPSVYEWVSGITKNMTAPNATKVCNFLRINVDWLLYKKGPSGLEDDTDNAPVLLTTEQKQVLKLLERMELKAKENWIANGELLVSVMSASDAVATPQSKPMESQPERRLATEDRRKTDLGFDPERRHLYGAPNFPEKKQTYTDRRRGKK